MIQLTKLSKVLSNKYVGWIKKNNHDYILSEQFIIKTNQEIKGSALTKLISLLGTVPQEDQGIQNRHGHVKQMTEDEMKSMLDLIKCKCKDKKSVYFTNLIHQTDKDLYSIFKGEKDYIFVNKLYLDLIDLHGKNIETYGTTRVSPIYFEKGNEEMMVLPIRLEQDPYHLKGNKND